VPPGALTAASATIIGTTPGGGTLNVGGTTTLSGDLLLGATARARIKATGWCDCEYGAETVDRFGTLVSASVPDLTLFENGQAATFQCRGGRFLVGIEKTSASCLTSIGCLEQYKCCRPCNFQRE
jgi:hypothetical protein